MADKVKKFLSKLPHDQLIYLLPYLHAIKANNTKEMDVKQLKGYKNVYRVRAGRYRIIFQTIDTA